MMSQESLARSWEFVVNSQVVQPETETEAETKKEETKAPEPVPEAAAPSPAPSGPTVIEGINPLASRISELAKEIGVPQAQAPSQPNCLQQLHQFLSKEAFAQVVRQIVNDSVGSLSQKPTELMFDVPVPTLNSTEEQKSFATDIVNGALPTLFDAMNPKTTPFCIELVRKFADHFNFVLRDTIYKELFFVSPIYLCIGKELGRGKFATVYEGRHAVTGQRLAIKMMDKQKLLAEDPRVEEFLQRETSIMKSLDHPNVVRLYDVLETPTSLFLVMEFCPGGTLGDYLATKKALPEEEVQRYIRQIAAGLQYMRARSVSHRDLKPANLLLVETAPGAPRVVKITDFTFARFLNPGEISKTLVGSPLYMAPEIFKDYQYDGVADLWSVGVIMFEMLVGQVPFPADTLIHLMSVLKTTEATVPNHIRLSHVCRHLLHHLLQKEPKKRISWEGFFNHPWLAQTAPAPAPAPAPIQYHAPVQHQPNATATGQNERIRKLEAEIKQLKEREESCKVFIQDQQRYMQEQNARIEQHRAAGEALREQVKKLQAELRDANDTIAAYKIAFTDSITVPFSSSS